MMNMRQGRQWLVIQDFRADFREDDVALNLGQFGLVVEDVLLEFGLQALLEAGIDNQLVDDTEYRPAQKTEEGPENTDDGKHVRCPRRAISASVRE